MEFNPIAPRYLYVVLLFLYDRLSLTYLTRPNFNILAFVRMGECAYYDADILRILHPNSAEETAFLVVDRWGFEQSQIIPSDVQWVLMVLFMDHDSRPTQTWGFNIWIYKKMATLQSNCIVLMEAWSAGPTAGCQWGMNWETWRLQLIGIAAHDESLTMFDHRRHMTSHWPCWTVWHTSSNQYPGTHIHIPVAKCFKVSATATWWNDQ